MRRDEDEVDPTQDSLEEPEPEPDVKSVPPRPFHGLEIINPDEFDDDDPDDEDADEFDDEEEVRTILITGASGNIGRKLRAAWEDVYDLILIDKSPDPDEPDLIVADLGEFDESWANYFEGVDTVIHLAADPNEFATWEELESPNLDALFNVFHASALAAVDRLIFASSNHAMGDYRELGDMPITVDLPPRPDGAYGATKLMGERLGRSLSVAYDVTFLGLRLGWVQSGANLPDTLPDAWSRSIWLSNGDLIRLFDAAVEAELGESLFVVVNGISNNRGTRWDLSETADRLGYAPEDDAYAEEF